MHVLWKRHSLGTSSDVLHSEEVHLHKDQEEGEERKEERKEEGQVEREEKADHRNHSDSC